MADPSLEQFKREYEDKIKKQFADKLDAEDFHSGSMPSSEYLQFKKDNLFEHFTFYEKLCNWSEKIMPIKPDPAKGVRIQRDIDTCHLQVTPTGVQSFSFMGPLLFMLIVGPLLYLLTSNIVMVFLAVIIGAALIIPIENLPSYFAQNWRIRVSNQMVITVFYIVTYMRHTSNLERAIEFASHHLAPPISLDLKKVIWDVETQKYDSINESLENYLLQWKESNNEFVTSMHVIMGSLYETSESKRQELLDKSLDMILEETYDKMLHYAHNLQSPISALHMLGIVLPILGLIILPLMVNFIPEVNWIYILLVYNVFLPVVIFVMGKTILSKRPAGYGGVEVDSNNVELQRRARLPVKFGFIEIPTTNGVPFILATFIIVTSLLIGFSPFIMHALGVPDIPLTILSDTEARADDGTNLTSCGYFHCTLGYKESKLEGHEGELIGPFGLGATLLSLFIPGGIALGLGLYFTLKSKNIIEFRNDTLELENEFTGALFQLGNRLGDGLPPEIAFNRVGSQMPNSRSGSFFNIISTNIQKLGMGLQDAIFNVKNGALVYYPSTLIESSMKILTQSAQKGPKVASNAIENVARYIKEMNRVNERLQDLMAEVISSMKSQVGFLTPIISGIVIGITSMITTILGLLAGQLAGIGGGDTGANVPATFSFDSFGDGVPTFYFQLIIGLYVVEVTILLTMLINSIQNGVDKINEQYLLGQNLLKSVFLYLGIALVIIILFNFLAGFILESFLGT
ncbi:MAG TPA: hypothetical protein VK158_05555 [Acidobacteriota bacterium]|nr:hypothetical protein [Acidobacteriota bacterium]